MFQAPWQHSPQPRWREAWEGGDSFRTVWKPQLPGPGQSVCSPRYWMLLLGLLSTSSFIKSSFIIFQSKLIVGNGTAALTIHVCSQARTSALF